MNPTTSRTQPPAAIPSPNIWRHPGVYELENRYADPEGEIPAALWQLCGGWRGATVVDLGCGSGYYLPFFAREAGSVVGVEPHPPLIRAARARVHDRHLGAQVRVLAGQAEAIPLPDHSVDLVHARWAYFFGPGCEPGLAELARVIRPGGSAVVIDNDATSSSFGRWFTRAHPSYDPMAVERFWHRRGWQRERRTIRWAMPDRDTLAAVLGIEFDASSVRTIMAEHPGVEVDYAVNLWHRRF